MLGVHLAAQFDNFLRTFQRQLLIGGRGFTGMRFVFLNRLVQAGGFLFSQFALGHDLGQGVIGFAQFIFRFADFLVKNPQRLTVGHGFRRFVGAAFDSGNQFAPDTHQATSRFKCSS